MTTEELLQKPINELLSYLFHTTIKELKALDENEDLVNRVGDYKGKVINAVNELKEQENLDDTFNWGYYFWVSGNVEVPEDVKKVTKDGDIVISKKLDPYLIRVEENGKWELIAKW